MNRKIPDIALDPPHESQNELISKSDPTSDDVREPRSSASDHLVHDLKGKTARGALISTFSQGVNFVFRIGSMVILARLLVPADFGLVGMVTACTGFLGLFRDAGLSMATVQRVSITHEQTSMLFWVNLGVGGVLAIFCAVVAPILARFYHEPRLFWVSVVVGTSFIFNGASAQHRATLQRSMRFAVLALIDVASIVGSVALGIWMAMAGQGYWALVGMVVCPPAVGMLGAWAAGRWIPVSPRRGTDVLAMLRYGGTVTLNNVIVYIAYNVDKVLIGRFLGAETLGIYGRAYQLINLPTENLNATIGLVAFPALSRLQNDPVRLKSYFLKGYGLFLSLVIPITTACALFADDIIHLFLGAKWGEAAPVFRLLAPTTLAFALINPLAWMMLAIGKTTRSLKIALVIAPVVILGYLAGLRYGSTGVAAGFSTATVLLVLPVIFWATRGTPIAMVDIFRAVLRPFLSILIGTAATFALWARIQSLTGVFPRLVAANTVLFGVYALVLCFVMGQKTIYLGLLREFGFRAFVRRRKSNAAVEREFLNDGSGKD